MKKINEIFYSLQGEGHHTGYPTVFIRFSGCNLNCGFCDTNHQEGILMSDNDIIRAVNLYSADWIVLTGGEPSLHIDDDFIRLLKKTTDKKIAIETNGTNKVSPLIDWVTVSPKNGVPGVAPHSLDVERADEIKVVDIGQDLEPYFSLHFRKENTLMYLQPCYDKDPKTFEANRLRTLRRVHADPRWTLSVQVHRYLGIP